MELGDGEVVLGDGLAGTTAHKSLTGSELYDTLGIRTATVPGGSVSEVFLCLPLGGLGW